MTAFLVLTILAALSSTVFADQALTVGAIFDQNDTAVSTAFKAALEGASLQPRIVQIKSSDEAEKAACDLLAKGVVALITDGAPAMTKTAARVAAKADMPHLSVAAALPSLELFSLQLWPKPDAVYRAVRKEMGAWSSDRLAFIVDRPNSGAAFKQMKKIFGDQAKLFSASALNQAKTKGYKTFVAEIPGSAVEAFLNAVRRFQMDKPEFSYFILSPDAVGLRTSPLHSQMRAKVRFFSIAPSLELGKSSGPSLELGKVLKTMQIPVKAALIYDAVQLLTKSLTETKKSAQIVTKGLPCSGRQSFPQGSSILNSMKLGLPQGIGVTGPVVYEGPERTNLKLQVLNISQGEKTFKRPRRQGKSPIGELRVVTLAEALFVQKEVKNGVVSYDGYAIALLKLLAEEIGFTYKIYESPDGSFGSYNSSNVWTGMIGELVNKKADMAVGSITITYEREKVVDFTTPFMTVTTNMLALKPKMASMSPFAFLQPFSSGTWITFFIAYIIVSLALFLVARLSPYEWHKPHDEAKYRVNKFGLHTAFWFTIAGCLRQYPGLAPRSTAARVLAGFWWLVVLIVFLFYAVNLAPFLKAERMTNPINTFSDLAQQTKIRSGTLAKGSTEAFFKRSNLDTYMTIYERMKADGGSFKKNYKDGIASVVQSEGSFVFIGEEPLLAKAAQQQCQLQVLPAGIDPKGYGFGLQQNSAYRSTINNALLKLQKTQKLAELTRRYLRQKGRCGDPNKKPEGVVGQLGMSQMYGIFLLLILGILIGLLCIVAETFAKRCCGSGEESFQMSEVRQSLTLSTKRTIVETEPAAAAPAEAEA